MVAKDAFADSEGEKVLRTLIQAIRICIQDIGMEFDIEKCVMLTKKSGKRETMETIELSDQERIGFLGEKDKSIAEQDIY